MRRLTPIDLFTETTCVHRVTSIDLFRKASQAGLIHAKEYLPMRQGDTVNKESLD